MVFQAVFFDDLEAVTLKGREADSRETPKKTPFLVTDTLSRYFTIAINTMKTTGASAEEILQAAALLSPSALSKHIGVEIEFEEVFGFKQEKLDVKILATECKALADSIGVEKISAEAQIIILERFSINRINVLPVFVKDKVSRSYQSDNLFDLAWAEVINAAEKKLPRIHRCPYCGTVYTAPPNFPDKKTCGAPACKRHYLIDSKGGPEEYKKWEYDRKFKRTPGERPVGRPPKKEV